MMNKIKYTNRMRMVVPLGVILGAGILFIGCDKPAETAKKPVTKAETQEPDTAVVGEKTSSVLEEVEACSDLIELHEKVAELKGASALSGKVSAKIEERHEALLAKAKIFHYTEKLDLLAVDLRMIGPGKARIYLLFRPNVRLTSDYKIGLWATVDKSHKMHLSADADVENLWEHWSFWPSSSKEWTPGEEILITKEANLKNIPYRLSVGLYANRPPHRLGDHLRLGWYIDLGDEE